MKKLEGWGGGGRKAEGREWERQRESDPPGEYWGDRDLSSSSLGWAP